MRSIGRSDRDGVAECQAGEPRCTCTQRRRGAAAAAAAAVEVRTDQQCGALAEHSQPYKTGFAGCLLPEADKAIAGLQRGQAKVRGPVHGKNGGPPG